MSRNQFEWATQRVAAAYLARTVEIRLQDYRHLTASTRFDRIASIGMFKHVGLRQLDAYFKTIHRLLKPGGRGP